MTSTLRGSIGDVVEIAWCDPKDLSGWWDLEQIKAWAATDDDQITVGVIVLREGAYLVVAPTVSGPEHWGGEKYANPFKIPYECITSIRILEDRSPESGG